MVDIIDKEAEKFQNAKKVAAELVKRMAPPGTYNIPPLLERRRIEYCIPNGSFEMQAAFDRILLHQVPEEKETYGDTGIIMPEVYKKAKAQEAAKGIVISAGLSALDHLRSNGIDIGHMVRFCRLAPWRFEVEHVMGVSYEVMILRDGDIIASLDLQESLKKGDCKIEVREGLIDGRKCQEHLFVDKEGNTWTPTDPWIQDDY